MTNQAPNLWCPDCLLLASHPEPVLNMGLPLPRINLPSKTEILLYIQDPEHEWEESLGPLLIMSLPSPRGMCPFSGRQGTRELKQKLPCPLWNSQVLKILKSIMEP